MIADELRPSIVRVAAGFLLSLGPFPLVTTPLEAIAKAISPIVCKLNNLPALTPVDLVALAGYTASKAIDKNKHRPLSAIWGHRLLAQWNAMHTTTVETNMPSFGDVFSEFAGQTIEPIFEE